MFAERLWIYDVSACMVAYYACDLTGRKAVDQFENMFIRFFSTYSSLSI